MTLVLDGAGKRYGDRWAVRGIDLELESGIVGLVGPNGAGKTTLMRMVASLVPATAGRITWNGVDVASHGAELRSRLGYLPQDFGLYGEFTARRFLTYIAAMKRLPGAQARRRVDELLELVNLSADAERRLRGFSGGMRRRVGIAQALLNDPPLVIVDEPTAGLDPLERVRFRTLLAGLAENRLILFSTHIVGDVEAIASRLVLMNQGRVLDDTTPERLTASAEGMVWAVTTDPRTAATLQARHPVSGMVAQGAHVTVRVIARAAPAPGALPVAASLEDAYLARMQAVEGGPRP